MEMQALKRQGKKTSWFFDENDSENQDEYKDESTSTTQLSKWRSDEAVGERNNISREMVRQYRRLNYLTTPLLKMADDHEIIIKVAVELSYLKVKEQNMVEEVLSTGEYKVDLNKAKLLRTYSKSGKLDEEKIIAILSGEADKKKKAKKPAAFKLKPKIVSWNRISFIYVYTIGMKFALIVNNRGCAVVKRVIAFLLLIILVVFILVIFFNVSRLEPETPKWSIGILAASSAKAGKVSGFKQGMNDLGFVEGENISYIFLDAEGKRENLLPLARQLVDRKPDVLVATGGVEADSLKNATVSQRIPIVFIGSASSVERGLVKSLLQPGRHFTGVDNFHAELAGKRLELLKKLLPSIQRVAVVYDPEVPPGYQSLKIVRETAGILDVDIGTIEISSKEDLKAKLKPEALQDYDALLPLSSFLVEAISRDLLDLSLQNNIPVMGIYGQEADSGFFAAYGGSMENQGYQGARLVAKVLDGQQPEQIPVETPDNLDLIVNLRTAKKLGLQLNETGLSFAKIIAK